MAACYLGFNALHMVEGLE